MRSNQLIIEPQQIVSAAGVNYEITNLIDVDRVLARNLETHKVEQLLVMNLQPAVSSNRFTQAENNSELTLIRESDWAIARRRFEIISPLVNNGHRRTVNQIESVAKKSKIHKATIYRWLKLYDESGRVSALLPRKSGFPCRKSKLAPEVEEIIKGAIENTYLNVSSG